MSNFKLLAIRPRKGCDKKFLKNLSSDQLYTFYSSIKYYDTNSNKITDNGEVAYYLKKSNAPKDLYQTKNYDNEIKYNLSAIVGKNGSGKSSLIELFFAAIFVFSLRKKLLFPSLEEAENKCISLKETIDKLNKKLRDNNNLIKDFSEAFDKEINKQSGRVNFNDAKKAILNQETEEKNIENQIQAEQKLFEQNEKIIEEFNTIPNQIYADIFYQCEGNIYELSISPDYDTGIKLFTIPNASQFEINDAAKTEINEGNEERHFEKRLFYTIAINYSHYALNSNFIGEWIRLLFHKNDGYRTPLVINPMRTDGNFDINDEMSFAKTRMLINVIIESINLPKGKRHIYVSENQFIKNVIFSLNKEKIRRIPKKVIITDENVYNGNLRDISLIKSFLEKALPEHFNNTHNYMNIIDFGLREALLNYIISKIDSISENYLEFQPGYTWDENDSAFFNNDSFLWKIINDKTHVTFKLHQAVNFLRYCINSNKNKYFYPSNEEVNNQKEIKYEITLNKLFEWMGKPTNDDLLQHLPPSIFEVDFKLNNKYQDISRFNDLSSGEQQFIHSIQAIIYHINNIQSAHSNPNRIKYKSINIILDEIELYFHPDFQRKFIFELLNKISQSQLNKQNNISAVNFLFLTHSPFILSDIPSENILQLPLNDSSDDSKIKTNETFAANIHELLARNFFIEGTTIGKFSEYKINELIDKIKLGDTLSESDSKLVNLVGDSFLRRNLEQLIEYYNDPHKI